MTTHTNTDLATAIATASGALAEAATALHAIARALASKPAPAPSQAPIGRRAPRRDRHPEKYDAWQKARCQLDQRRAYQRAYVAGIKVAAEAALAAGVPVGPTATQGLRIAYIAACRRAARAETQRRRSATVH